MQKKIFNAVIFSLISLITLYGSALAFNNSDLEGTWYAYLSEVNPAAGVYWVYGTFTVDSSGNITGGSYTAPDGTNVAVTGGKFTVDSEGVVGGTIIAEGGVTGSFPSGKLDRNKSIAAFVGVDTNESLDVGVAIKAGQPSSGSSGCFIATAAYGSYWEPHVMILRQFRDSYLLSNKLGTKFVEAYYKYSPPVANYIIQHDSLRSAARIGLAPLIGFSWLAMNLGMIFALAVLISMMTLIVGGTCIMIRAIKAN